MSKTIKKDNVIAYDFQQITEGRRPAIDRVEVFKDNWHRSLQKGFALYLKKNLEMNTRVQERAMVAEKALEGLSQGYFIHGKREASEFLLFLDPMLVSNLITVQLGGQVRPDGKVLKEDLSRIELNLLLKFHDFFLRELTHGLKLLGQTAPLKIFNCEMKKELVLLRYPDKAWCLFESVMPEGALKVYLPQEIFL